MSPSPNTAMKKEAIVLYPCSAAGHFFSMVELGKLLSTTRPSISVHFLVFNQGYQGGSAPSLLPSISSTATTNPSITFHYLTTILPLADFSSPHLETLGFATHNHLNPEVHQTLVSISDHHHVVALVADFFCTTAQNVTEELSIPCYYFLPSNAGFLNLILYLSTLHDKCPNETYTNPSTVLHVPGIPPLPVPELLAPLKDRTDEAYKWFLELSRNMAKSAGIILNTFERLEPRPVRALIDTSEPPIYCIGPLVLNQKMVEEDQSLILKWLDSQPSGSVVFLCFGSMGTFSTAQLKEMAVGLERSGQRFLWVVRNPWPDLKTLLESSSQQLETNLESLLPEGFMDRTKERGLVVKNWAPQVAVLNHGSVGGFVTHCGWNSVLEAVGAGVPLIGWPLYAEQRLNKLLLVEEMKIAVPMNTSENGLVSAAEVEKRVKELMESEVGRSLRKRILAMKEEAGAALRSPDGSSQVGLTRFVDSLVRRG